MENIAYIQAASAYESSQIDSNFVTTINFNQLSSIATINILSISLTLFILSNIGQALALEKYGNKNISVTNIQNCLKQLGYFNNSVTGFYGSITEKAVINFQKDNQQTADGIVGSNTEKTLQSKCSTHQPTNNQKSVLKLGSRSEQVKQLQQDLKKLNYLVNNPSGYFGPITKDAVIQFQKAKGLQSDGIVGEITASTIKTSLKQANNSVGGENFSLTLGSRGAEVILLQKRLQQLKYFTGDLNGYYGVSTRDAVIRFQKNMRLTIDGIVGAKTQQAIDRRIQQLKQVKPQSNKILPLTVGSCSQGNCPNLRIGSKNRYVKYLQTRLRHWSSFKSNPNGNYDFKTVEAVKRFQKATGLSPDGVVGPQTWKKIENPQTKKPKTGTLKTEKSQKCNKPVLQRGDKGNCVIELQQRLQNLGYFKGNPTSYFGTNTWEAVKQFQFSNELPPNGIVNSQTWKALKALEKNSNNYIVLIPVTSPYTLDEVRRFVPDAFIRDTKLGKFIQTGEFKYLKGAEEYSQRFLRDRGFNARVVSKNKL